MDRLFRAYGARRTLLPFGNAVAGARALFRKLARAVFGTGVGGTFVLIDDTFVLIGDTFVLLAVLGIG